MNHNSLALYGILFSSALALASCGSSSMPAMPNPGDGGGEADNTDAGNTTGGPVEGGGIEAGAPVTGLMDQTWTWVAVPEAHCRDGSSTGFGINPNSASKKLMIFLEGGGACFNLITCSVNPSAFSGNNYTGSSAGIFNRADMANPVKDWNFVDVPYCTGDVHAGDNPNGSVPGVTGAQQFVGYTNVAKYLARILPTFPGLTQVLLTGVSAGGFGASANYGQVARAFGSVPVYLLDDSGPAMGDPFAASCLQQQWVSLWGFDKTVLAECGSDCPDPTNFATDAAKHVAKLYPHTPFGLVEDTDDMTITQFYGFGQNNCTGSFTTPLSAQQFTAGLDDMRMRLSAYPNFGAFIFNGTRHTTLTTQAFDSQTAGGGDGGGVPLTDWITQLVNNGTVTNVGPP
jgi:Pectinacetylesterase